MVIICKEIYFVSYLQMETVDRDKIVNDDFPNQWKCTPTATFFSSMGFFYIDVLPSHLMRSNNFLISICYA